MNDQRLQAYLSFISTHQKALARIAWNTKGDYQRRDVESEAWLLADEMLTEFGAAFDLSDPATQDQLLGRLYARLVKFGEKNVRYAVRLDQSYDDEEGAGHPLLRKLAAPNESNPLAAALAAETPEIEEPVVNPHESSAAAYVWLLQRFDNRVSALARYLLISISHCYRCIDRAKFLVTAQKPLGDSRSAVSPASDIRPWRTYRFQRTVVQLELPFPDRQGFWLR